MKRFTQQEIETLQKNPNVKHIKENKIIFTYEFRKIIYDAWMKKPCDATIRLVLSEHGINTKLLGKNVIHGIGITFKRYGLPKRGKNNIFGETASTFRTDKGYDEYLLSTGKFIKNRKGISFSDEFINEIYHEYPDVSIEEQLIKNQIDPEKVGYHRIYQLKLKLDGNQRVSTRLSYNNQFIERYSLHPYVKRCTENHFVLSDPFYQEANVYSSLHIDEILEIFEIDYRVLDISLKNRIKYKLKKRNTTDVETIDNCSELYLKIQRNKSEKLIQMIDRNFSEISKLMPSLSCAQKKKLCSWIQDFPCDRYDFTVRKILKRIGLSKSQYYFILKNDGYGKAEHDKEIQDEKDVEIIKTVLSSEKYPMGHRMVYMRMKEITGIQFGKRKILRLMKKFNLSSKVRKSKESRIEARKQLEERKKTNLLKREFRLHKPYEVALTDVSYLRYADGKTAYLSAVKDSVSGRIYTMDVSESNDLTLVETSLDHLCDYEFHNSLFHSDQGALYLNDSFQEKVKKLGFTQSMSKRGNCWDNASQESFFGHFKDECRDIIRQCSSVEELKAAADEYMTYYNERRPQWNRNQMTPIEYEKYLLSMNDEEFDRYMKTEHQKYDRMMQKAKEKAVARTTDLGAGG